MKFGYTMRWSGSSGSTTTIESDWCDQRSEAVLGCFRTAVRCGWTPRRWWQWWRWYERSNIEILEAIAESCRDDAKAESESKRLVGAGI